MKQLLWIVFLFLCAIGLALLARSYTGDVYLVLAHTMVRVNLNLFIIATMAAVFMWYLIIRLLAGIMGVPHKLGVFGISRRTD